MSGTDTPQTPTRDVGVNVQAGGHQLRAETPRGDNLVVNVTSGQPGAPEVTFEEANEQLAELLRRTEGEA